MKKIWEKIESEGIAFYPDPKHERNGNALPSVPHLSKEVSKNKTTAP
jgi:hypothetical protein